MSPGGAPGAPWVGARQSGFGYTGSVEGSVFERIADEAIDLDHYVEGFRIVGNDVRDAVCATLQNGRLVSGTFNASGTLVVEVR